MANTDVTITLAGQFSVLTPRQLRLAELGGKMVCNLASGTKATAAQWNTVLATAIQLFPPQSARNMQVQHAALYWQEAIAQINAGVAVAGRSNSQILDVASYLQGLDDKALDAVSLYLEGKACLFSSVFT